MPEARRSTERPIVNVVRTLGQLTEPFIKQRTSVTLPGVPGEIWFERRLTSTEEDSRKIHLPLVASGSFGDRVYHRAPQIGPPLAGSYREAEHLVKPRVIHAHFATTGYLVGSVTRSPLVVSAYGFDISVLARQRLWRSAYRRLARRVSVVLVEGPFMRSRVMELGFAREAVRVVRIGADLQDVEFCAPRSIGDAPVTLLSCGRMVEKKGHAIAIHAFAAAQHQLPVGSTLGIIGSGPLAAPLMRLAERLGVSATVSFVGAVSRAEFHDRLRKADLFLAPSITASNGDSEGGAPTTILDAQASGTVVVASKHADIPFLVDDGRTGYLADEGDSGALATMIIRAVADAARWPDMALDARQRVVQLHSDQVVSAALADIYREVA